jgi:hypothetical protein
MKLGFPAHGGRHRRPVAGLAPPGTWPTWQDTGRPIHNGPSHGMYMARLLETGLPMYSPHDWPKNMGSHGSGQRPVPQPLPMVLGSI